MSSPPRRRLDRWSPGLGIASLSGRGVGFWLGALELVLFAVLFAGFAQSDFA